MGITTHENKYLSTENYLRQGMRAYNPDGLFCFQMSMGGGIKDVMTMLSKVLRELDEEANGLGIIADGKFPMFEHGTLCLFHNDHCKDGKVCHMETYDSKPEAKWTGKKHLSNLEYWRDLDEVADLMAVVCKKPNALIGGDPKAYNCVGDHLDRYYRVTKEVSAVLGARGIVSDDCISFLRHVSIPDQLHVAAECVESWSAYVVMRALRATYASQVQIEHLRLRHISAGFSEVTYSILYTSAAADASPLAFLRVSS